MLARGLDGNAPDPGGANAGGVGGVPMEPGGGYCCIEKEEDMAVGGNTAVAISKITMAIYARLPATHQENNCSCSY